MTFPLWPFPYMLFSTSAEDHVVAIQNDRLVRTWQFREGQSYPGYQELAGDLEARFAQFTEVVTAELERDVEITASECYYVNELPGVQAAELLVGVSSGWTLSGADVELPPTHFAGVRMHLDDPDIPGSHVQINADSEEEGATLSIMSRYILTGEEDDAGSRLGGLEQAHAALIRTFLRFTSSEMQSEWGKST